MLSFRGWRIAAGLLAVSLVAGCGGVSDSAGETASSENEPVEKETEKGEASAEKSSETEKKQEEKELGSVDDYDAILEKYVKGDYFDYAGLKNNAEDMARFERFLRWQADADVDAMSREEQIAFYINAYNSCCIKAVLDHYPVQSPKEIEGFFDGLKFEVAGEKLTISEIEYERLIADYRDMRAHFAVVCADRGCLPLKAGAYRGEKLDAQLETAAEKFVEDDRQFEVDREKREVRVSKIFDWYGEKFLKDPKRRVEEGRPELYLAQWVESEEVRKLLESGDYELKFIEWDWTLNEEGAEPYEEPSAEGEEESGK